MVAGSPPLYGVRVLEFAGLAPGPFAGLLLADYGATVLRLDRAIPNSTHTPNPPPPTPDQLTRRKSSIAVDIKSSGGVALIKTLLHHVDVVIDPFRPGVLEKAGLGPSEVMMKINPKLIVGRMTGFRRDGKYSLMAGHDINYIAVSGVLSMLGRKGEKPYPPGNILGDFAGGGMICFVGILLALIGRQQSGRGQVVEANMVDGSAILATMPRLAMNSETWGGERGTNRLDGGCPYYGTYETKDGKYMAVGALEPQFFAALLKGLSIPASSIPGDRENRNTWPWIYENFTRIFKSKTRKEWEDIFDGTDACCTPVLTQWELRDGGYQQRPAVTLRDTPAYAIADEKEKLDIPEVRGQSIGVEGEGWSEEGLSPSVGGEEILGRWMGWKKGRGYDVQNGGLVKSEGARL
ncbi:CoA-transferase family III [Rhizodiscina lignyota]|uniref:CoA-transferase family III n=1 Tax=Rhizodiscina lignyota TaxID=1504668 RepID=A0A9P4M3V9_9PEZI|nr:CoA-transferase family III [Rhizodiscina lignyota]